MSTLLLDPRLDDIFHKLCNVDGKIRTVKFSCERALAKVRDGCSDSRRFDSPKAKFAKRRVDVIRCQHE
jgi:hypothetical protein